jgi:hypothetical protein
VTAYTRQVWALPLSLAMRFRLRDDCPLRCAVPRASATTWFCNFCWVGHDPDQAPYNPCRATHDRLHATGLGGRVVGFRIRDYHALWSAFPEPFR